MRDVIATLLRGGGTMTSFGNNSKDIDYSGFDENEKHRGELQKTGGSDNVDDFRI